MSHPAALVEAVAHALWANVNRIGEMQQGLRSDGSAQVYEPGWTWPTTSHELNEHWRRAARAAIAAYEDWTGKNWRIFKEDVKDFAMTDKVTPALYEDDK